MSISELIIWIIWLYLFGILVSRTIESVKRDHYERKRKKAEKEVKKALDDYYKHRTYMKSSEKCLDIDEIWDLDDADGQQEMGNFITDVNDSWFDDIDEEEALQYISDWRSPEEYVTYMEEFYQWDDDVSDDNSDDNLKEKAEDYKNDMSSLWYDITDDEAEEMSEEWFDPEDYAEEYDEENRDDNY